MFKILFNAEIPLPRLNGKSPGDVFASPHKFHSTNHPHHPHHHHGSILRDFPENYESFRNGVSPERRSSTSSEGDSIVSDTKATRNLTKAFENNSGGDVFRTKISHEKTTNTLNSSKRSVSSNLDPVQTLNQQQTNRSSHNKRSGSQGPLSNNVGNMSEGKCAGDDKEKDGKLWPAWVYCTRYSDRPSSGE